MRPAYPVDLVPLLPEFLNKRRAKLRFPLEEMERLGIDRPSLFFAINLVVNGGEAGLTTGEIPSPYATIRDAWMPAAAAASGAGLVDERGGTWRATAAARELVLRLRREAHAHFATLAPIPVPDLRALADRCERAVRASLAAPGPKRDHMRRIERYRQGDVADAPLAALDDAVFALWMVRDDCHVAAWSPSGLDGPVFDVLTRVWRGEAGTVDELAPKLASQRPADVAAAIAALRERRLVAGGEPLAVTDEGRALRQRIEDETDRLFFAPWPDDVGREGGWIREKLAAVVASF